MSTVVPPSSGRPVGPVGHQGARVDIIQRGPDEERKASMARNRMVVSRGDQPPSPVVNVGSRYS
ncbi:MAG TPA: hypothetical protein VFE19_10720 [Jatrophihabitantaceae bacterium]|nr:hypothetical protein [Jatrophihabitantaceae bacterium]